MWLTCSGSLLANLAAKDSAGFEAAEGTVAHSVGEEWLKTEERPDHLVGDIVEVDEGDEVFHIEITTEMLDYVQQYVDWCMYLPGDTFVEKRVYFSQLTPIPKQGGTADHFACEPGVLTITDLKYGIGEPVSAEENTQAMLYALGVFYEWDWMYHFERIVIRIAQPRRDNMDVWETTRDRLMEFAGYVKARAALAWVPNAPRTPSEKGCRWCKVKGDCPAYLTIAEDIADDAFADFDEISTERMERAMKRLDQRIDPPKLEKPMKLTTRQLVKLNEYGPLFKAFFEGIEEELTSRAQDGEKVPGKKLVEGISHRVFTSEAEAEEAAEEAGLDALDLYDVKMKTPAQTEELLMKRLGLKKAEAVKVLAKAVRKPPGKPKLVPITDKRPELLIDVDEVYADL